MCDAKQAHTITAHHITAHHWNNTQSDVHPLMPAWVDAASSLILKTEKHRRRVQGDETIKTFQIEYKSGYRTTGYGYMYLNLSKPGDSSSLKYNDGYDNKQWDCKAVFGFVVDGVEDKNAPRGYKFSTIRFTVNPVRIMAKLYKRGLVAQEQALQGEFY
ncbi:hypothetical protein B0H63DRAFT_449948 [Podospora didyma]|uniref:Uncharacterized protein n=1 Tax=Podospora didyma TaxID=330526 RepID=A0AAE0NQQ7_9PEZI|nr:hypothetical protein B0H63DRAFT_449948 [Podospora didyma]